jgi:hypothetical protein
MGRVSAERVAVFIDWQNLYKGARGAFHDAQAPSRLGMVGPIRLGKRLIQLGHGRDRELIDVRVYRGRPDPTHDPRGYAANRRQQAAWERSGVTVVQRPCATQRHGRLNGRRRRASTWRSPSTS